ncbi:hypothetical protein [Variovorax sp. J22R115]|uniref:hypothetical protein n=1 Tax=Variovorax sp. J22R115 TaxID=3053509 RepID=UPI0025788CEC|nr:hypothetical protein [Variovorax sp. J22R115]MDM0053554.1 hypothetical protein [Variovorax sp. J22R115]
MAIYVRIDTGRSASDTRSDCLRFFGSIVASRLAPVADYTLHGWARGEPYESHPISRLEHYSRWSEPGLALAARLIDNSPPSFLADRLEALPLTAAFSVGASPLDAVEVEVLTVDVQDRMFWAALSTPVKNLLTCVLPLDSGMPLRAAFLQCCFGVLDWHLHPSPIPEPLTSVPVRQGKSGPVVALPDIPAHPRAHLVQRLGLKSWPPSVPADLWLNFIGPDAVSAPDGSREQGPCESAKCARASSSHPLSGENAS